MEMNQQPENGDNLSPNSASASGGDAGKTGMAHCPYRQASLLLQALASDKMKVAFFLGAGCPTAIRVKDGNGTKPLIPDTLGLTEQVCEFLAGTELASGSKMILARLTSNGRTDINVEEMLTHIRLLSEVIGNSEIDGLSKKMLLDLDVKICQAITDIVKPRLDNDRTPYHSLARWIRSIPRAHPVEIFTSNYDLLIEQALEENRVPFFDGFVGSDRPFFDVSSMEQDKLPARWARLWKVHGSINWWRTPLENVERRSTRPEEGDRQMICPSYQKYDQSRRMPFVAMIDRLRAFFGQGQTVLVTCGCSFADEHLRDVIVQGLTANPTAMCFGLLYGDRSGAPKEIVTHARNLTNLSLLTADGAVLGGVDADWRRDEKTEHPLHGMAVKVGEMKPRSIAPSDQCKFLLGDFNALGEFLTYQLAQTKSDKGNENAA